MIGIVAEHTIIAFYSADGKPRGRIDARGIVLGANYAWNGCSPKRWVWPFGWIGTPDFPAGRKQTGIVLASGFHDLLYQFSRTEHFPLNRSDVDAIFYETIAMAGEPDIASIYHGAVRKFGSWTERPRNGEFSMLL